MEAEVRDLTLSPGRPSALARWRPALMGAAGFAAVFGLWELLAAVHLIDPILASRPTLVLADLAAAWAEGEMLTHTVTTLKEFAVGYSLAVAAGIPAAILMALFRYVEYSADLFLWFLYNAPLVAFYPVLIIWLGLGTPTVIAICFLLAVFPVIVSTLVGIQTVDPSLVRCARSFRAPRMKLFTQVVLPAAIPMIIAGMRIAVGRGMIGVVVGELFGANEGLGFVIAKSGVMLQTARVMSAITMLVVLGVLLTSAMQLVEHRFERWRTG